MRAAVVPVPEIRMSEAPFYTATLPVECPKCGKTSRKLLRELLANTLILCSHCPTAIDIGSPEWRQRIDREVARVRGPTPTAS